MLGGCRVRAAALGLLVLACHGERDEARRAEAGRVAFAVESVRSAPNEGKRPLLLALEQTPCTAEDVCAVKATCVDAYTTLVRALEGVAAVRRAVRDPAAPNGAAMAELLARSEADLSRAEALSKGCVDREGEMRRREKL